MEAKPTNPIGILVREPWIDAAPNFQTLIEELLDIDFNLLEIPEKYPFTQEEVSYLQGLNKDGKVSFTLHSSSPKGRVNLTNLAAPFKIEETFQLAESIGAKVATFDFDPVFDLAKESYYPTIKTRVETVMKAARDHGVVAAFECGDPRDPDKTGVSKFGSVPEDFQKLIEDFPELKITLDFGHLFLSSKYWGFDWKKDFIEPLASRIVHTHIHANFGKDSGKGKWRLSEEMGDLHLPLDMGQLPWKEMIRALQATKYDGAFLLELKSERVLPSRSEILKSIRGSHRLLSNFVNQNPNA